MTVKEAIELVKRGDAKAAGAIADALRAKGYNYNQTFALVRAEYPELDVAEWDQMLAECDEGGAR